MADKEHPIMTKTLPEILDELEARDKEYKALIDELHDLYHQLQEALAEITNATAQAQQAAAEAREAGVKAAAEAKEAAAEALADVRAKADEAFYVINIIGSALMTAADGIKNVSENLIRQLGTKFEFKK